MRQACRCGREADGAGLEGGQQWGTPWDGPRGRAQVWRERRYLGCPAARRAPAGRGRSPPLPPLQRPHSSPQRRGWAEQRCRARPPPRTCCAEEQREREREAGHPARGGAVWRSGATEGGRGPAKGADFRSARSQKELEGDCRVARMASRALARLLAAIRSRNIWRSCSHPAAVTLSSCQNCCSRSPGAFTAPVVRPEQGQQGCSARAAAAGPGCGGSAGGPAAAAAPAGSGQDPAAAPLRGLCSLPLWPRRASWASRPCMQGRLALTGQSRQRYPSPMAPAGPHTAPRDEAHEAGTCGAGWNAGWTPACRSATPDRCQRRHRVAQPPAGWGRGAAAATWKAASCRTRGMPAVAAPALAEHHHHVGQHSNHLLQRRCMPGWLDAAHAGAPRQPAHA